MVILVMGVTGAGKTTVGKLLAATLEWKFADADDFHSTANVDKISRGIPLEESDREPWLTTLSAAITRWIEEKENVVLACSALKRSYRKALGVEESANAKVVYLKGSYDLIYNRLRGRHEHFATESILASQFADLEEPQKVESPNSNTDAGTRSTIVVDVSRPPAEIVADIQASFSLP